jgi:hypothetical protein
MSTPTRAQIARRRAIAVGAAAAATALIWLVLLRGDDAEEAGGGVAPGGGVPASVRGLVDELSPEDQRGVAGALIEAVGTGQISEDRLDEAVGRVLVLKQELGLIE